MRCGKCSTCVEGWDDIGKWSGAHPAFSTASVGGVDNP